MKIASESDAFDKVIKCISTITDVKQLPACHKLIENFEKIYGKDPAAILEHLMYKIDSIYDL